MPDTQPTLIVVGGYPGSGKTTIARQLAADLRVPRLSSDEIGHSIRTAHDSQDTSLNATAIAYDVVFDLCAAFIQSDVSTMLDLNMGWQFQWQRLDELRVQHPGVHCVTLILRCPREVCHARIAQRHARDPASDPAERFATEARFFDLWQFLEQLDRPDVHWIDAAPPLDAVYCDVRRRL